MASSFDRELKLNPFSLRGFALALIATLFATFAAAAPASAESSAPAAGSSDSATVYVFWSQWNGSGTNWQLATTGAASSTPADGSVEGWRYGAGSATGVDQAPRQAPDFTTACQNTPAVSGNKRVAVVIDYGTTALAPSGQTPPGLATYCASVPTNANGSQVLSAVTSVRTGTDGMICGISGYPSSGCSVAVSAAQASDGATNAPTTSSNSSTSTSSSTSWVPFVIGAIVIIVLIVAAVAISRKRNS